MDSTLKEFLGKIGDRIDRLLAVLGVVTTYFSFLGAKLLADAAGVTWLNRSSAVIYAVGTGVAIFTFWTIALRVVPTLPAGRFRLAGMGITAGGCLAVVAISAWLNVTGLGGPAAMDIHMTGVIAAYEDGLSTVYGEARRAEALITDLRAHSRRFARMAEDERKSGRISGTPGPGTVSETLIDLSVQLDDLANAVETYLADVGKLSETARSQLESLRHQAALDAPAADRMRAMAATGDKLRATLQEMRGKSPGASAARVIRALSAGIAAKPVDGRSHRVQESQRRALAEVQGRMEETARDVALLATNLNGPDGPSQGVPVVERIGPMEAVYRHAGALVPMWAGGIAIDLIPTVIILYLMLVYAVREDAEEERDRLRDMTLAQIEDSQRALMRLKRPQALPPPQD
ncbi:MAG: hypothetical protein H6907_09970 [Hyphomicrobiales bacterium]|nr:hypothetical protein [Hyphomicrobiales bacterium]MCP5372045.1 hypothetical protein [Hyphomicrobiales bacterium]